MQHKFYSSMLPPAKTFPCPRAQASSDEEELQRLEADFSLNDVLLFRTLAERAMTAACERTPRTSTDSVETPPQDARCDCRPSTAVSHWHDTSNRCLA